MALKFEHRITFLFVYIFGLHAIAVLIFTRGFLLTRNELPLFSQCDDVHEDVGCNLAKRPDVPACKNNSDFFHAVSSEDEKRHCFNQTTAEQVIKESPIATGPSCWTPPAVKKVVILVFDALRFDFVAPSSLFENKPRPWMDRLQVVQKLILEESSRARLFKFVADPPTTSLQRLKGLTTGSLPTFIDVGNSFGASAIVEDNIIHQLTSNGKKVIMMGDDTWLDLFPSQFFRAFPYPSFDVKDLHTVDDGVLENLFPTLYEDNWDVLIGHFLGVDHVGHIFGVESPQMVEKLEQYNKVVEDVITVIGNQSECNGLHSETLLLVLGDHGQTLNGDHGGGSLEEVETALFAWSSQEPTHPVSGFCDSSCINDAAIQNSVVRQSQYCICDFQQLDFAATFAAILGIPFPYGSIGKVNPHLFGLVAGMWHPPQHASDMDEDEPPSVKWLNVYSSVLCLNSWQVNRYFQQYSKSSMNGISPNDLVILSNLYNDAQSFSKEWSMRAPNRDAARALLSVKLGRYLKYLHAAAALARSKWTKFNDGLMAFGLGVLLISLLIQIKAMYICIVVGSASLSAKVEDYTILLPHGKMITSGFIFGVISASASTVGSVIVCVFSGGSVSLSGTQIVIIFLGGTVLGTAKSYLSRRTLESTYNNKSRKLRNNWEKWFACPHSMGLLAFSFCCIHACSLLSNSFILREQQVVTFLLVTIGLLDLRMAVQQQSRVPQALCFLILNFIMSSLSGVNLSKENAYQTKETTPGLAISLELIWHFLFAVFTVHVPLIAIGCALVKKLWRSCFFSARFSKVVLNGLPCTYAALCLHWLLEDLDNLQVLSIPVAIQELARLQLPRALYSIVASQIVLLLYSIMDTKRHSEIQLKRLFQDASFAMLAVLSSLFLLLLGRQGPIIAVTAGLEVWCLVEKQLLYGPPQVDSKAALDYSPATIQWSLFAVQLFFCTGHRCAFDGLRYGAAFIGFDHFNIYRQGALLALDTFGASHILPIISLPLLISKRIPSIRTISPNDFNDFYKIQLSQDMLLFELVRTILTISTTVCVTIQRRHLMVWGLFAPKFVFDAIGLLVTDVVVLFGFLYVTWPF